MTSETAAVAIFDNYWATSLAFARSLGEKGVPSLGPALANALGGRVKQLPFRAADLRR